jgi:hypothetical protein
VEEVVVVVVVVAVEVVAVAAVVGEETGRGSGWWKEAMACTAPWCAVSSATGRRPLSPLSSCSTELCAAAHRTLRASSGAWLREAPTTRGRRSTDAHTV